MADEAKKPRKVKDLKARLGRTISPGGAAAQGAVAPPPVVGAKPGGVVPPPTMGGAGVAPPGLGARVPSPPFAQPKKAEADPFAAKAASAGPQEVRLVIDEKPVDDKEVGRARRGRVFLLVGVGLALGLLLGVGAGNGLKDRTLYNQAVRDGKDIYQTVRDASETITKAQRFIDAAVHTARGGQGHSPAVDYQAIEALRALEKPLEANAFARKKYGAFNTSTVDKLFEYYNDVNLLWDKLGRLANRTLPEARRHALDESAESTQNVTTPVGCVPAMTDNQLSCGLVYVRVPEDGDGLHALVRTQLRSNQEFEKIIFTGAEDQTLAESPDNYVVLVHPEHSIGVLGQQAGEFAQYSADLTEIKTLVDHTMEIQGQLETELGEIARLEELWEPF